MIRFAARSISAIALLSSCSLLAAGQSRGQLKEFAPGIVSGGDVFGITFTSDGRTVYFCQTDPDVKHIQIMESHLVRGKWQKAMPAPFSLGPYRDIDPFITVDGKHLIFNSNRPPDGKGEALKTFDIYIMDA